MMMVMIRTTKVNIDVGATKPLNLKKGNQEKREWGETSYQRYDNNILHQHWFSTLFSTGPQYCPSASEPPCCLWFGTIIASRVCLKGSVGRQLARVQNRPTIWLRLTCTDSREEEQPEKAEDGCCHHLVDSSRVDFLIQFGGQVGIIHVIPVYQVLQQHVHQSCRQNSNQRVLNVPSQCKNSLQFFSEKCHSPNGTIIGQVMLQVMTTVKTFIIQA